MNSYKTNHGRQRFINAWRHSLRGLQATYQHEAPFREEVWIALFLIPLGFWLGEGAVEKVLLVGSVLLLLLVELMNSAVESVVDRIGLEHHVLSGRAKDQGSAAVLITIILVCVTWGLILFD